MSDESNLSLLELPVEILFCMLDQMDTKDILFSLRNVCKYLHTITSHYNRYKFRLTSTLSKADVHRLSRILQPEKVVSLTLRNQHGESDRMELFLSLFDISRFTRLQSLDLYGITSKDLNKILHHILTIPTCISLALGSIFDFSDNDSVNLLSLVVAKSSIRKLNVRTIEPSIYQVSCPDQCKLQRLTIKVCDHVQLCHILDHLPNLRVFSTDYFPMNTTDHIIHPKSIHQLTSLTLRGSHMLINQLESLLTFTPSLVYLHIANHFCALDFLQRLSQWEQFSRQKLPLLEQFKFYANTADYQYENVKDIELLLNSFRTYFWLKHKCSYITCKYLKSSGRSNIMLYSSSDSNIKFPDDLPSGLLSYMTSTTKYDDIVNINNSWSVRLNPSKMANAISSHKLKPPTDRILCNMTKLALDINWPINSFDFLSSLTDFSQLVEIWVYLSDYHYFDSYTLDNLLDLVHNVRIFGISCDDYSTLVWEDICSVLCRHVQHLKIRTIDIECIQRVFEYVEQLSSVTFVWDQVSINTWPDIIAWLTERECKFSFAKDCRSLQVWFKTG